MRDQKAESDQSQARTPTLPIVAASQYTASTVVDIAKEGSLGLPAVLRVFREGFHACFKRRADALFELCDAILTAGTVPSLSDV